MRCPRCELSLVTTEYEGVEVEICETCWGFWLDGGELAEILASRELEFDEEERKQILSVRDASRSGPRTVIRCPKCSKTMERIHIDESVHLVIDHCAEHGYWLDTGEIKKVQALAEGSRHVHGTLIAKLGLSSRKRG